MTYNVFVGTLNLAESTMYKVHAAKFFSLFW